MAPSRFDRYRLPPRPRSGPGWTRILAVALVVVGLFVTGAAIGRDVGFEAPDWLLGNERRSDDALEPSRPVRIEIPSIDVKADVHPVGLAPDGSIAVPSLDRHEETGWYEGGPTPGQYGPAIIVGHNDTRDGPSVFHRVPELRRGARVEVTRADGSVAIFKVTSVERFDKGALPAQRVYADFSQPGLRLITCGGQFVGGSIGYSDNVIAFATMISSRE